jgi:hypothetical protein
MKMPDIADSILVQPSDTILPTGWMAYDTDDRVVEVGYLGIGRTQIGGNGNVTRIVCGRQFYDELRLFIANQTRHGWDQDERV